MLRFTSLSSFLLVGLLGLTLIGCGDGTPTAEKATEVRDTAALNEVAEAYRVYTLTKNKPPAKPADLKAVEAIGGNGVALALKGDIVIQWGAILPDTKEDGGQSDASEILAYGKDVPTQGGVVLLLNRSIKTLTADEFKAAKLAGSSAPSTN